MGRDFTNLIGNLYLACAGLSAFICIMRTDYNFTFCLFFYFLWTVKKDQEIPKILLYGNAALIIVDILWFTSVGAAWSSLSETNEVWNSMRGWHFFLIFLSFLEIVLKAVICGLLYMTTKRQDDSRTLMLNQQ
mmetsp:Transcript_12688/g.10844  ORF Transcript_12688/g.10844 Transcript_12688/m.10844 type:complete len:133 (+) Transcript_12688:46-444(+)